jgi:hypothetical protein
MNSASRPIIVLLLVFAFASAWAQPSSYDPAQKPQSTQRDGFLDFALKQFNPQNADYGCQIEEARKIAVEQTLKSIEGWAGVIALTFLVLAFFLLLHQHRESNRRELITSGFVAQYHNAWVDACRQARDGIRQYNELVHRVNGASETPLNVSSADAEHQQANGNKDGLARRAKPESVADAGGKGTAQNDKARQHREPEVDYLAQIRTLQQQLNASHEREKNLQKELSKAQRRMPGLQPKGANLPG